MRKLAIAVVMVPAIVAPGVAFAAWHVEERTNAMTDARVSYAVVTNKDGHELKVTRWDDGRVWATFRLADRSLDVLGERSPMVRVDKLEPQDLDSFRTSSVPLLAAMIQSEPKWVSWVIFHGNGPANNGALRDLMNGHRVVIRYYLFTGGYKETDFTLAGAKVAIAKAVGVPAEVEAVTPDEDRELTENIDGAT